LSDTLHIYTRVSTSAQEDDGTSLETQKDLGIKKAKELGMIPRVWNEGGQSSKHDDLDNRPVLVALLAAVAAGEVENIWVFNTDRLSRNDQTWGLIRLKLLQHDVTLHTASGIFSISNPTDKLMLGILSEISSYDNALRAERSRLGKMNRLKQGFWMGGPPPFGFKIERKKLVVNPDEAKWVKFIFKSYCERKTVYAIRRHLMEQGVKTRRQRTVWSLGSLEALLTNTHYSGHYTVTDRKSGEVIRCECPPILPPLLVRETGRIRAQRSKRRVRESNQKHFYLLRDFLVCDHCGNRFSGRTYPRQNRSVYYCPRKERNYVNVGTAKEVKCSNSRYLKIGSTDDLVWQTVVKVLSESAQFKDEFKKNLLSEKGSHETRAAELSKLRSQIKKLELEIQQVGETLANLETDRLIQRRSPTEIARIITDIEKHRVTLIARKDEAEGRIGKFAERLKWINWVTHFGERIDQMDKFTPSERHELLANVLEDISVRTLNARSHRLTIKFKLPYYQDSILWIDPKNRSKGYEIKPGKAEIRVPVTDAKKKQKN
jgi:site-specific DNA recombinase